jgi:hypothetical protein
MVMVASLFGLVLVIGGIFLCRRRRKVIGSFLILIGGALLIMGIGHIKFPSVTYSSPPSHPTRSFQKRGWSLPGQRGFLAL